MARGIARIGNETSIRSLAARLYDLSGPNRAADLRRVVAALLKANPNLRHADGFAAGTVIIVPEIGLGRTSSVELPAADLDGTLREAAARIQQLAGAAENGFAASENEQKTALANLSDERFVAEFVKSNRDSARLIRQAQHTIRKHEAGEKEMAERLKRGISDISKEISHLQRLVKKNA